MDKDKFHCCATCRHFAIERTSKRLLYKCSRLEYETKPAYKFNCWDPKSHIRQILEAHNGKDASLPAQDGK